MAFSLRRREYDRQELEDFLEYFSMKHTELEKRRGIVSYRPRVLTFVPMFEPFDREQACSSEDMNEYCQWLANHSNDKA